MKLLSKSLEYQYDSREEMIEHIKKMEADGYYCKTHFDDPFFYAEFVK